jgi:hypothetical protein
VSPVPRIRAGSECAVKTTCEAGVAAARTRSARRSTKPGSTPHSRTKCVSARPATAPSNSSRYLAIESDDQCGASTSPTSVSWPRRSASSTAVPIRGCQWRMPVSTGSPSNASSAARVSSVIALSGEGSSESSIPSAR